MSSFRCSTGDPCGVLCSWYFTSFTTVTSYWDWSESSFRLIVFCYCRWRGNTSSKSKLKISSISTEKADRGEGKSKLEISDGVDRFECESDCFSVVSDEQDVVVPCLISSHNLCNSSAFWSMLSIAPSLEGSRTSPHVIFWQGILPSIA